MAGETSHSRASTPRPGAMRRVLAGLPSALADLLTAACCIAVWWSPQALPDGLTRSMALVMVIEFLATHSFIMAPILAVVLSERWPRVGLALVALLYFGFAAGASVALQTWWPTLFFGWLLLSRYVLPRWNLGGADEHLDIVQLWLVSTLLWIVLGLTTVLLPVPALGWDAAAISQLGLPGEGIWVDEPQRLLAFASSYFLLLAAFKLSATPQPDGSRKRDARSSRRQRRRGTKSDQR